jgi:hypothetical protein
MRRLLIISPNFPPISAPDMHRVRMSLPHFAEFGWEPRVLAVDPRQVEGVRDRLLMETIPSNVRVHHTTALDIAWTRKLGVGAIGVRALPFLYLAGKRLIAGDSPDLVYFSTTAFPVMALGRLWKQRFGVPFVVDMQDPWATDLDDTRTRFGRLSKHSIARSMHRMLEPFTMRAVNGIIAVSTAYHETLRRRYPWISPEACRTIPFGASEEDFAIANKMKWTNPFFKPRDGLIHGVYVGRGGTDVDKSVSALFAAWKRGREEQPDLFSKIRFHFIGTDYAPKGRERKTIEPVARSFGLDELVREYPLRVPYYEALRCLLDADFLAVPGSDDPRYTASKIYPYILARKPLLAVFNSQSSVVPLLEKTHAGSVVTFQANDQALQIAEKVFPLLTNLLQALPFTPNTDWKEFEPYRAREMTRRQCELFDLVVQKHEKKAK